MPYQERIIPSVDIMCGPIKKQTAGDALRDAEHARKDKQYRRDLICELAGCGKRAVLNEIGHLTYAEPLRSMLDTA